MFTNRDLTVTAVFAAILVGYGYPASITLRQFTRSFDLFLLIACLFTIITISLQRPWAATLLGTVSGVLFLFPLVVVPQSVPPHIAASLIANGLVFDLYLRRVRADYEHVPRVQMVIAGSLGNLAMAAVGLAILQILGPYFGIVLPWFVWPVGLIGDSLIGAAGSALGVSIAKRVRGYLAIQRHPRVIVS